MGQCVGSSAASTRRTRRRPSAACRVHCGEARGVSAPRPRSMSAASAPSPRGLSRPRPPRRRPRWAGPGRRRGLQGRGRDGEAHGGLRVLRRHQGGIGVFVPALRRACLGRSALLGVHGRILRIPGSMPPWTGEEPAATRQPGGYSADGDIVRSPDKWTTRPTLQAIDPERQTRTQKSAQPIPVLAEKIRTLVVAGMACHEHRQMAPCTDHLMSISSPAELERRGIVLLS